MKDPDIRKADLLAKLNEIHEQLEELENVLHSTYLNHKQEIKKLQTDQLDLVEGKLGILEANIDKQINKEHSRISRTHTSYSKLELRIDNI